MQRWVMIGLLAVVMCGCADIRDWNSRTFAGLDCSAKVLQANNGNCVPVKKGR
jgi:hypothetical protein